MQATEEKAFISMKSTSQAQIFMCYILVYAYMFNFTFTQRDIEIDTDLYLWLEARERPHRMLFSPL